MTITTATTTLTAFHLFNDHYSTTHHDVLFFTIHYYYAPIHIFDGRVWGDKDMMVLVMVYSEQSSSSSHEEAKRRMKRISGGKEGAKCRKAGLSNYLLLTSLNAFNASGFTLSLPLFSHGSCLSSSSTRLLFSFSNGWMEGRTDIKDYIRRGKTRGRIEEGRDGQIPCMMTMMMGCSACDSSSGTSSYTLESHLPSFSHEVYKRWEFRRRK